MNRACLTKDGKLIEMQSGGRVDRSFNRVCNEENQANNNKEWDALEAMRLDTLKQNALNAGHKEDEIIVKWVSEEEWGVIQEAINKPTPEQVVEQETEKLIQAKMREMAIAALIKEGKIK